jgi:hypothetical protein
LLFRLGSAARKLTPEITERHGAVICLQGSIDQAVLRNLVIWHNRILFSPRGPDARSEMDITMILAGADEARLFELISVVLMLDRVRSFELLWDGQKAPSMTSIGSPEANRRCDGIAPFDLAAMPREIVIDVDRNGSQGGIRSLPSGRKIANDYVKLALPGRFIIAVALRERSDGAADSGELDAWLAQIEKHRAQHPYLGFVLLNRLAPSQRREWAMHVRFARHEGLTLQDAVCLAQIADGFLGVLDVFGLAAHSAGRPGVYIALEEVDPAQAGAVSSEHRQQIMIGCRDSQGIGGAVADFLATCSFQN